MCASPMLELLRIGPINRPIFSIYWAGKMFLRRGLFVYYRNRYLIAGQVGPKDDGSC